MIPLSLLVLLTILGAFIYIKVRKSQRFFQERDVPCVQPTFLLGSRPAGTFLLRHISETQAEMYNELSPHKIGGFYELFQPFYMIRDPDFIHQVLSTNWTHFHDRGFHIDENVNPMDENLAFTNGEKYRYLRAALNPIFAPSKLRWMFEEIVLCTDLFMDHVQDNVPMGLEKDLKHTIIRHSMNVIASTVLGAELSSFEDPASTELIEITRKFTRPTFRNGIILFLRMIWPSFLLAMKVTTISTEITDYFVTTIRRAIQNQTEGGNARKNMIQQFINLRNGELAGDTNDIDEEISALAPETVGKGRYKIELTDETVAAQAFIFSIGGTDTTYATIYGFLYLVALHPEKQEKARQEVLSLKSKHGDFTYECVSEMRYLGWCINETLRLLSPVSVLPRVCTKPFVFPDGTSLNVGDRVIIPTCCVHRDPVYYPEPLKFIPERFSSPSKPGTNLAFGGGPKICIGKRFAEITIKLALARLLESYKFEPCARDLGRTDMDIKFKPKSFLPLPIQGYKVVLRQINR